MAQIIPFPGSMPVLEGEIVSEVPINALPSGHQIAPAVTNRFASVEPCEPPKRRRKPRAKMRVEQHEVTCAKVPRKQHRDLRNLVGVLTLDFKGETPWTATFDPSDKAIPNVVAPIEKLVARDGAYEVTTDEGVWSFQIVEDDSDEEE